MRKNFILDTNVLLHDPQSVFRFDDNCVLIPIEVIQEIDQFKRDMNELGRNSRMVATLLDHLREKGKLAEGVELDNGGTLRIVCGEPRRRPDVPGMELGDEVDRRILSLAIHLQGTPNNGNVIVVTKDVNLRLRADVLDICARDYRAQKITDPELYTGWHVLNVAPPVVELLNNGRKAKLPPGPFLPNEFVMLQADGDESNNALGRVGKDASEVFPIDNIGGDGAVGIKPLNLEQTFALSALLDDSIGLVTLSGKAGTGKTLLAVAAALHKVFVEDRYNRVLVFRPTMPLGNDIGYLPGTVEEKMQPWMQPIMDALELIREEDKRARKRALPPDIMACEEISIEPLTYIRGRSIPHQFIVIDEAQNLTPLEVKTVITRVGVGTKIVLTGDPNQIDNPYIDALSNGLTFLMDRFRTSDLAAHIGLYKGERSALAETAANLL